MSTKLEAATLDGKLALMTEDGIVEPKRYVLITTEDGINHLRAESMSILTMLHVTVEAACREGITDMELIEAVSEVLAAVYSRKIPK